MILNEADIQSCKIRSLIERMEKPHTGRQGMLNEERHLNEGVERKVESPNQVFDILDQIGKNSFVCLGYVTGANLDLPKVKRVNPETNRMKSYDDYETFGANVGSEEKIGALVKITSYNFRYYNTNDFKSMYGKYKNDFNNVRGEFGLPPVGDKENGYKQTADFGNGVDLYSGGDEKKQGNFYIGANTHGAHVKGIVYAVNEQGNIIQELTDEQVKPYLKEKGEEVPGANALRKMGADEERVKSYIEKVKALKFNYKQFEGNSILWVAATVNGQKIIYINSNLSKAVNGIDINREDFVAKAIERYQVDTSNIENA